MTDDTEDDKPHTIGSLLAPPPSSTTNLPSEVERMTPRALTPAQRATVAMQLSRLAIHYYRRDFTEGQVKALMQDMVEDLSEFRPDEIENAIREWRRDPKQEYFPRAAQLAQIVRASRRHRRDMGSCQQADPEFGDLRPYDWEYIRPQFWKPHWKVEDLERARDPERRARYDRWAARTEGR